MEKKSKHPALRKSTYFCAKPYLTLVYENGALMENGRKQEGDYHSSLS